MNRRRAYCHLPGINPDSVTSKEFLLEKPNSTLLSDPGPLAHETRLQSLNLIENN